MSKNFALITASGRGTRFDAEGIPKQYLPIAEISILRHSILAFLNNPRVDNVLCVIHPDDVRLYEESVAGLDILDPVFGGDTRQVSVRKGLEALQEYDPDKVLIHDSVRPFVSRLIIDGTLDKLETHPAVIPAVAVEDTIKKYSDGKIEWTLERQDLWRAQTPQGFIYEDIINSHQAFKDLNFTDDAALNEYAGIPVAIIPGSQNNFKITTKEDYERAQRVASTLNFKIKEEIRVGTGFDFHKFIKKEKGKGYISLCATKVDHNKSIKAHSDGDVAIHALIDALLGSVAMGDIGDHFPDIDEKYKDIDSSKMLKEVLSILRKKGASIVNIDLTIIAEEPKISKYKQEMKSNLARILNIEKSRINIKGTTTEKMGFLGKKEGIAASCSCSVKMSSVEK
jgi:2-C-methyl-D-erythritol 4-phosphate cytidylyltransferase / 2-C-methyl-D-erythritol 2,4-cyclodiphosphate synthase